MESHHDEAGQQSMKTKTLESNHSESMKTKNGFVQGVRRRFRHLRQIVHAAKALSPDVAKDGSASERCISPVLKHAVRDIPLPSVTEPALSRSPASSDTMAEREAEDASSARGSSSYATAPAATEDHGDIRSIGPSVSSEGSHLLIDRFGLDAASSNYVTAGEGSEDNEPGMLEPLSSHRDVAAAEPLEQMDVGAEPQQGTETSSTRPPLSAPRSPSLAEPSLLPSESMSDPSESNLAPAGPTSETPSEEFRVMSPPSIFVEPPVPDPFLVDDPSDPISDDESAAMSDEQLSVHPAEEISLAASTSLPLPSPTSFPLSDEQLSVHPAEEISLAASTSLPLPSPTSFPPDLNKSVPPTPAPISDDEEDEDDTPELYLPALVHPTMFLPIPNTDPLTTLLAKYISDPSLRPVRDLSGEWQGRDFHTLVTTNSWRALARMARDRIVASDPEDISLVLDLWYLRLSSLARLRLTNQTSAELNNVFSVLHSIQPAFSREYLLDKLVPFELEVLNARGKYWAGDHMGYLDALWSLVKKCKKKTKEIDRRKGKKKGGNIVGEKEMWVERGVRVCLIIASELIEMKDFPAATKLLTPLLKSNPNPSPDLQSAVARIYLQSGHLSLAAKHLAAVKVDPNASQTLKDMNDSMLATAEGDWVRATEALHQVLANDPGNFAAVNNLAVVLLSEGKIKEGIDVLETALRASPSTVVVAEPFLFNLSTLYELRSATAADKKRELLVEVAKWSGDGLKTACLKMPSN